MGFDSWENCEHCSLPRLTKWQFVFGLRTRQVLSGSARFSASYGYVLSMRGRDDFWDVEERELPGEKMMLVSFFVLVLFVRWEILNSTQGCLMFLNSHGIPSGTLAGRYRQAKVLRYIVNFWHWVCLERPFLRAATLVSCSHSFFLDAARCRAYTTSAPSC